MLYKSKDSIDIKEATIYSIRYGTVYNYDNSVAIKAKLYTLSGMELYTLISFL